MEFFDASDGIRIAYRSWPADSPLPTVVLHHGFAVDHNLNWVAAGIVPALQKAGRAVVAIDARGHGQSDKPHDPARYGEERMAQDLTRLLDLLDQPSYDLVGYSMGAVVSLICASREPRVRRLVIGGVGEGVVACGGVDRRTLDPAKLAEGLSAASLEQVTDERVRSFRQTAEAIGADLTALAAQCQMVHAEPLALSQVGVPTLLITGRDDDLAIRPQVLVDALPRGSGLLVDGDHMMAVIQPQFAGGLVDFLQASDSPD